MLISDLPAWFAKRWAADTTSSYIRSVPATTADPNAASMSLGFPPNTFTDEGAGGSPPDGRDFNGIFNYLSAWAQWIGAGAPVPYNPAISSNGGYPRGSVVLSASTAGLSWESTTDGNTTNPEGTSPAGWVPRISRRADVSTLVTGTDDVSHASAKGLKDAGFDPIIQQSLGVTGYRSYRSGFKECWGRVNIGANSSLTISIPITHTNFIIPVIGAGISNDGASPSRVGVLPPALDQFVIVNNDSIMQTVNWSTRGS